MKLTFLNSDESDVNDFLFKTDKLTLLLCGYGLIPGICHFPETIYSLCQNWVMKFWANPVGSPQDSATRGQNTYNTTGATFQLIGNLLQGEKNARGTKPRTLDFNFKKTMPLLGSV